MDKRQFLAGAAALAATPALAQAQKRKHPTHALGGFHTIVSLPS